MLLSVIKEYRRFPVQCVAENPAIFPSKVEIILPLSQGCHESQKRKGHGGAWEHSGTVNTFLVTVTMPDPLCGRQADQLASRSSPFRSPLLQYPSTPALGES